MFQGLPFNNRLLWPKYQEQPISHKDKYLWQSRFLQPDVFLLGALGWEAGRGTRSGASSGLSKGNVLRERFHSFITAAGGGGGGKKKRKIDGEVKRD